MRPFRDDPSRLIAGRWQWCPPGASALPFAHAFGSYFDLSEQSVEDPVIGEVPIFGGWTDGESNPRYLGKNYCGAIANWQNGSLVADLGSTPVDAEGVPLCCVTLPMTPGGPALGGTAAQGVKNPLNVGGRAGNAIKAFPPSVLFGVAGKAGHGLYGPPSPRPMVVGGLAGQVVAAVPSSPRPMVVGGLAAQVVAAVPSSPRPMVVGGLGAQVVAAVPSSPLPMVVGGLGAQVVAAVPSSPLPMVVGGLAAQGVAAVPSSPLPMVVGGLAAQVVAAVPSSPLPMVVGGLAAQGVAAVPSSPLPMVVGGLAADILSAGAGPPVPGNSCATAGTLSLGVAAPDAGTVTQTDWWVIPGVPAGTYTLTDTTSTTGFVFVVNIAVQTGPCSSLMLVSSPATNTATPFTWPGGDMYVSRGFNVFLGGTWSYNFTIN
jgi:hypothetical protein